MAYCCDIVRESSHPRKPTIRLSYTNFTDCYYSTPYLCFTAWYRYSESIPRVSNSLWGQHKVTRLIPGLGAQSLSILNNWNSDSLQFSDGGGFDWDIQSCNYETIRTPPAPRRGGSRILWVRGGGDRTPGHGKNTRSAKVGGGSGPPYT